ncbi:MAG: hypothetical protein MZV70_33000 [Desulfobacterales bacterium]|nr:hypothetical protein [Desulfobacterales bacterium]
MSLQEASREIGRAGLATVLFQGQKCYLRSDILDWLTREFKPRRGPSRPGRAVERRDGA